MLKFTNRYKITGNKKKLPSYSAVTCLDNTTNSDHKLSETLPATAQSLDITFISINRQKG